MSEKERQHNEVRKRLNANEMELSSLTASRRSASESSLSATSAKEVAQYQNQEIQFATRLQEVEEDTLPLMERMEVVQGELDELTDSVEETEPELKSLEEAEAARVKTLDEQIETMGLERAKLAEGINPTILKQYDSIRRSKRGVGLAEVVGAERCGGCSVKLPIHVLQKAKRDDSGKTRCPSCGRILWFKNEQVDA